jgi:hypothetical protein
MRRGYRTGVERGATAVESIKNAGSRAVETVGEHPMPAALMGLGLAWLLLENSSIRPTQTRILERGREAIGEVGHTIADAAGTAGHAIAEAVGTAAETVAEGASSVAEYASDAASAVSERTSSGYEAIGSLWERHPLAMSAAILAAGVAAGLLLPVTRRESSLMGDAASSVVKKVRSKSSELVEEGRRMAATGVKAAAREGRRQGITSDEIVHKVKRIARSARKAVAE